MKCKNCPAVKVLSIHDPDDFACQILRVNVTQNTTCPTEKIFEIENLIADWRKVVMVEIHQAISLPANAGAWVLMQPNNRFPMTKVYHPDDAHTCYLNRGRYTKMTVGEAESRGLTCCQKCAHAILQQQQGSR